MSSSSSIKGSPLPQPLYISESESGVEASASSAGDEDDSVMGVPCAQIPPQQTLLHRVVTGNGTVGSSGVGHNNATSSTSNPPPQSPTCAFNITIPYSVSSTSSLSDQERYQGGIPTPSSGYEGDTEGVPASDINTAERKHRLRQQWHLLQQQQQAEHRPPKRKHEKNHSQHHQEDSTDTIDEDRGNIN